MRQLILDLLPDSPPTLDNFVAGGNGEAVAALTGWLAGQLEATAFCLHGEAGCGKSHLLQEIGRAQRLNSSHLKLSRMPSSA